MKFRGGDFSTGTTGNFQPELTLADRPEQQVQQPRQNKQSIGTFAHGSPFFGGAFLRGGTNPRFGMKHRRTERGTWTTTNRWN